MELEVTSGIIISMNYGAILLPQDLADPLKHTKLLKRLSKYPKDLGGFSLSPLFVNAFLTQKVDCFHCRMSNV